MSSALTPLCNILPIFGDLPAEHSVHFLDQLRAQVFDASADLCEHQLALKASSLHKGSRNNRIIGQEILGELIFMSQICHKYKFSL